jgi:hypothetical protein
MTQVKRRKVSRKAQGASELQRVESTLRKVLGNEVVGGRYVRKSRRVWARKRSPHVFSKSQEAFGLIYYKGVRCIRVEEVEVLEKAKSLLLAVSERAGVSEVRWETTI